MEDIEAALSFDEAQGLDPGRWPEMGFPESRLSPPSRRFMDTLSPGSHVSEICRAEQLRPLDRCNRVPPIVGMKGADRPLYLYAWRY